VSALDARIAALSPEKRKALARLLAARGDAYNVFPLSSQQRRLWFLHRLAPDSPFYNVPLALRLSGALDVPALQAALMALVERHEALRTSFHALNGEPMQRVGAAHLDWQVERIAGASAPESEAAARAALEREVRRPFDLEAGALLRARLLRLHETEHLLALSLHHIICDGWSLGVLLRELVQAYSAKVAGRPPEFPALPLQYADYAAWQSRREREGAYDADLAFWRRELAGAPPVLELPGDRPRPATLQWSGAHLRFVLPPDLVAALRALAGSTQATPFMLLLAAFHALLARWSGSADVCVGTPLAQRPRTELEPLVGFFANTLVVRADSAGAPSVRAFVARVRAACLAAFAHQEAPLEQIVDALEVRREANRHPLFQVALALQNAPLEAPSLPGLHLEVEPLGTGTVQFDLVLNLQPAGDSLTGTLAYSTELFDEARATRFVEHYRRLLQHFVDSPDRGLDTLPLEDRDDETWRAWGRAAATASALPGVRELVVLDGAGRRQAVGLPGDVWYLGDGTPPVDGEPEARPHPADAGVWLRRAGWRATWSASGRLQPPAPPDTRASRARQAERHALAVAGVRDAHAFELATGGEAGLGLALALEDDRAAERLEAQLATLLAQEPGLLLLPLAQLPLTETGEVDECALQALVAQIQAAARLERDLTTRPGLTGVAVVRHQAAPEARALTLDELLPGTRWPSVASLAGSPVHGA
jgi:hypothetical protein